MLKCCGVCDDAEDDAGSVTDVEDDDDDVGEVHSSR